MIHRYEMDGTYIVLDVESGSVHQVDPLAYDAIGQIDAAGGPDPSGRIPGREALASDLLAAHGADGTVSREDVLDVLSDIEDLAGQGLLFAAPQKDLPNADVRPDAPQVVKALCLHVAHSCNLNCSYCFAGQGEYQGDRGLMSLEVARQAMDFLVANSGSRRNLEVDFFGGEPLLNWEVVKETVRYARELEKTHDKVFRFTLTTNGLLIDPEVIDFCNREIHNVVLSLDGRREIHDKLRKTWNGQGSYDLVVPKFQEFVAAREGRDYYIRGTFTRENLDFTQDLYHMAELGFTELSMEPVVAAPGAPYALTDADLPALYRQYEDLAREMLRREKEGRPFTFYHYMLDLESGPCIYKRITGCGSGTEYLAATPWGDLYPCHQFVGEESFCMGDVWNGVTRPELRDAFRGCSVLTREACLDCWARLYCSGGCAANAWHAAGDIGAVYEYGCMLFKKRMECAVYMAVKRQEEPAESGGKELP